ncbi:uncharacterized protein LOC110231947 [Exaiptasia diaphana]|uniref:Receptor ligand binding region domain-containing protein n=1 Tax=Exaiptasia diaphana TaxID=2652724 RepID=A0A913WQR7_EXADI|nr:uncharacterized protein LOC110231947 [Exaiptasia diaphana]
MKTFNIIYCVIFIYCCLDFAVFRIIGLTTTNLKTINIGIIQRSGFQNSWTNATMLEKALEQLNSDSDANNSINFNFEYIYEANLSSIKGCFDLLCGIFAPRQLQALVTTFDDHETKMLTQCAGLAGISVIGTSRSISFQNKKKYPNYNNLFPFLSEEMLLLHSIVDSIGSNHFALLSGDDEDSVSVISSLISTMKTHKSTDHSQQFILFNLTKTQGVVSKTQILHILESIKSLSIKVIVLVCDGKDTEKILQASLDTGLLGRDYLWIGTERVVRYMEQVTDRWLPENIIGMQLRVIPEQTGK